MEAQAIATTSLGQAGQLSLRETQVTVPNFVLTTSPYRVLLGDGPS